MRIRRNTNSTRVPEYRILYHTCKEIENLSGLCSVPPSPSKKGQSLPDKNGESGVTSDTPHPEACRINAHQPTMSTYSRTSVCVCACVCVRLMPQTVRWKMISEVTRTCVSKRGGRGAAAEAEAETEEAEEAEAEAEERVCVWCAGGTARKHCCLTT